MHHKQKESIDFVCKTTKGISKETSSEWKVPMSQKDNFNTSCLFVYILLCTCAYHLIPVLMDSILTIMFFPSLLATCHREIQMFVVSRFWWQWYNNTIPEGICVDTTQNKNLGVDAWFCEYCRISYNSSTLDGTGELYPLKLWCLWWRVPKQK